MHKNHKIRTYLCYVLRLVLRIINVINNNFGCITFCEIFTKNKPAITLFCLIHFNPIYLHLQRTVTRNILHIIIITTSLLIVIYCYLSYQGIFK